MSVVRLNLALQGGGAHGAFTWGALERLLEDERFEIAGISGTSAGALNAAALKSGHAKGGREGAIAALNHLWTEVGAITDARFSDWLAAAAPSATAMASILEYSPAWLMLDAASRMVSPYLLGPLLRNPLEKIVEDFEFGSICGEGGPRLFICATNVRTGKAKVFSGQGVTPKAIMASACLPTLFQAVEIDGEAYWDGGYSGNPSLFPLYRRDLPDDIVIININPMRRETLPRDSQQIANRINEVSFNASLLADLRAVAFVKRLIKEGKIERGSMKDVRIHMVGDDELMNDLNVATKTIPVPVVLARLRAAGHAAMDAFLEEHGPVLGHEATVDLRKLLAAD